MSAYRVIIGCRNCKTESTVLTIPRGVSVGSYIVGTFEGGGNRHAACTNCGVASLDKDDVQAVVVL